MLLWLFGPVERCDVYLSSDYRFQLRPPRSARRASRVDQGSDFLTFEPESASLVRASRRAASLPSAAALGGMVLPALIYRLVVPQGPWSAGWGVPMATDTAFALAIIALMGARVPVELRIILTAASIVDDIGAIIVVAIFYSGDLRVVYLVSAAAITRTTGSDESRRHLSRHALCPRGCRAVGLYIYGRSSRHAGWHLTKSSRSSQWATHVTRRNDSRSDV